YTDGATTLTTPWSAVQGLTLEEIKIATVKTTARRSLQGETYFGTDIVGQIGRLSADGTVATLNWATLPAVTEHFRAGLYVDQTGIFGGDLIVVPSDSQATPGTTKTVWRVRANGTPTLVANLISSHLEGLITLPNDMQKWGPWAGKIVTGDEVDHVVYA